MDTNNPRVLFAGTPEFAAQCLAHLIDSPFKPRAVLTQPDRPSGRGRKLTPSPVKSLASDHNIPILQPTSLKHEESLSEVSAYQPDILIVVAYGLILPKPVLDLPPLGCINVHASLLPRWRGAAPIERAFLAGDTETGVSIMAMDEGLDTGPVYQMRRLKIGTTTTIDGLYDDMANAGSEALLEVLRSLYSDQPMQAEPQDSKGVTYADKLTSKDRSPNWSNSANQLARQVSALASRMPVRCAVRNKHGDEKGVQLVSAAVTDSVDVAESGGEIVGVGTSGLEVQCATGRLLVDLIKLEGKGTMDAAAAINGYPNLFCIGSRFV